jgi:precorrin-6A/cobalt-precorrin-6A reductase
LILVFGGTTEGKKAAKFLEKEALPYFYSTKTEIEFDKGQFGSYRFGAFSAAELIVFCQEKKINTIIHASHPFAEILHQTIAEASSFLSLPVIRFERQYPVKSVSKDVIYVKNYAEAIDYLNTKKIEKLLALTGVQTIEKLESYWKKNNTYFRILPRESSLAIAEKAGFPKENLILEFPSDDLNYEIEILKKYNCQAVITKESGESGFLSTKIEAARICKIPIVIIERVMLPKNFLLVSSEADLYNFMVLKK